MLVPFLNINIGGVNLQYNLINTIILIAFLWQYRMRVKEININIYKPFIFIYLFYIIMMPFQNFPLSISLNYWRADFMNTILFPIIIWNVYKFDPSLFKPLLNTILLCLSIALIYGILLTQIPGFNPYLSLVLPINGGKFNDLYAFSDDGRVFGRISSVFGHPMSFGLIISLSIVFIYSIRNRINKYLDIILLGLALINMLFCGVRSTIGATAIGVVTFLSLSKKIKTVFYVSIIAFCLLQITQIIPGMEDYLSSITNTNSNKQTVVGSSTELRIAQLKGALNEIKYCPIEGRGFGWVANYLETKGDHPILLAFESLLYIILCNNGYLGIFAWLITIIYTYKQSTKYKQKGIYVFTLFIVYLAYACITGEYGYLKYMLIFYTIINMDNSEYIRKNKLIKKHIYESKSNSILSSTIPSIQRKR